MKRVKFKRFMRGHSSSEVEAKKKVYMDCILLSGFVHRNFVMGLFGGYGLAEKRILGTKYVSSFVE